LIPLLPNELAENRFQERDLVLLVNRLRKMALQVAQRELFVTTDLTAAPTAIWTSDDMPENSTWDVEVMVLGLATDGSAAGYRRIARFKRGAGTSSLIAAAATPVADAEDVAGWDVAVTATGNGVLIEVTGDVTRTVSWSAVVRVRELKA